MTWWLWLGFTFAVLLVVGRVLTLLRGSPQPEDIRYHWHSWIGRLAARFSDNKAGNWKMTFGRHTFVREGVIEPKSRAHEFSHSLDMHRLSVPLAVAQCVYQYMRHGYRDAPVEVRAREYAVQHQDQFPELHA